MSKAPLALAREPLRAAEEVAWSSNRSRKGFAQHQLFAVLVLRQFFKADYRDDAAVLADLSDLRSAVGLGKAPH